MTTDYHIVAKPKILPLHYNTCLVAMMTDFHCIDHWSEVRYKWWSESLSTGNSVLWLLLQKSMEKLLDVHK